MAVYMRLSLIQLILFTIVSSPVSTIFNDSGDLPVDDYYQHGDIILGGIVRLYYSKTDKPFCTTLANTGVQVAAAIRYAIEKINNDSSILKKFKLGYALMNDCDRENVALARATKFLPLNQCVREGCTSQTHDGLIKGSKVAEFYDVVGVMGPYSSPSAGPVSSLLSVYKVPVMSWSASSSELSDKEKFAYFSRTIPADDRMIDAIVEILIKFNWTYVSALHSEGIYGASAMRQFRNRTKSKGICIAYEKELGPYDNNATYKEVITKLKKNYTAAKIVVLFIDGNTAQDLIYALHETKAAKDFIFIGTEGFQPKRAKGPKVPLTALSITVLNPDPEFEAYYKKLNPMRDKTNPWIGEYTPEKLNCTLTASDGSGLKHCNEYKTFEDVKGFEVYDGIGRVGNIVNTYALALDKLLEENCPDANADQLKECIKGELLLGYMRNTTFQGPTHKVSYDSKGNVYGNYSIIFLFGNSTGEEVTQYIEIDVGSWEQMTNELILETEKILWGNSTILPESVCSKPCGPGKYKLYGEVECCWTCEKCPDNSKIVKENDRKYVCEKCPEKEWPNEIYRNDCVRIDPTYMKWHDPYACAMVSASLTGLISVVIITCIVSRHWERKVIKGASRELMVAILIGLTLAYSTIFVLVAKPSKPTCILNFAGFNLSCSLMFGPLFLKTLRLHLIFQASARYRSRVKLADSKSLMTALSIIILLQIILMIIVATIWPIDTEEDPRNAGKLELHCEIKKPVLLAPLSYNILLLFLCGIYGFLTRKLPENYNESWYIFIAVTTTLFIWTACIPTYFITIYDYHKAALLSLALMVNAVVISVCLFSPKIYALFYVEERHIKITHMSSRRLSVAVGYTDNRNNGAAL